MKSRANIRPALFCVLLILPLALGYMRSDSNTDKISFVQAMDQTEKSEDGLEGASASEIDTDTESEPEVELNYIIVDITGEVLNPGVYSIPEGSRICDLILAAGGLTDNCDLLYINRAEFLFDGMKVHIPSKDDLNANNQGIGQTAVQSVTKTQPININTANSEELQTIPGIGPSTAEKIIAYRMIHGRFTNLDELLNISGIGPKTLEKMKGYITLR